MVAAMSVRWTRASSSAFRPHRVKLLPSTDKRRFTDAFLPPRSRRQACSRTADNDQCLAALQARGGGYPVGMRTLAKLISVITVVLLFLVPSLHASANNIMVWTFVASLDTGSMAGKTFPVCYSYDADQVAPVGE